MGKFGLAGRRAAGSATAVIVAGGLATVAGATQQAFAAASAPSCSHVTCTVTFSSAQTGQSFTVPYGVSSLSVTLNGAAGGSDGGAAGGAGAAVTATLAVTGGEALTVDVGGAGGTAGGVNGGGSAADGAGGGGATDVAASGTLLLVAGGGGGAGAPGTVSSAYACGTASIALGGSVPGGSGGNADAAGGNGTGVTVTATAGTFAISGGAGGASGSTGTGGAGGTSTGTDPCTTPTDDPGNAGGNGSGTAGGNATFTDVSSVGGGGGGGYHGGGAGGSGFTSTSAQGTVQSGGGGGGGGSSYTGGAGVSNASVNDAGSSGGGSAAFSYADPVSIGRTSYSTNDNTKLVVSGPGLLPATVPAGQVDSVTAPSTTTARGGSVTVASTGGFTYTPPAGFAGLDFFSFTVTDQFGDTSSGTAVIIVNAPPVFRVDYPPLRVYQGSGYSYRFFASGVPAPRYSLSGAPSWLSINDRSGQVYGTVPLGTRWFSYAVTAANPAGTTTTRTFFVTVLRLPQWIHFRAPRTGVVGKAAVLRASGGGSGNPVTFAVDRSSGRGVCRVYGDTVWYLAPGICVIDAYQAGNAVFAPARPVRAAILVGTVPRFTAHSPSKTATAGKGYSYKFAASGHPAPAFVLISGPSWLHINGRTGQLSGTVPAGTKSFSYVVAAVNAVAKATARFTVSVK